MLRFMLFLPGIVAACAPQGPKSVTPVPSESPRPPQLSARAETPKHLVLRGSACGGAGPDLHVEIKRVDTSRVEYSVTIVDRAAEIHHAVVERAAANDVRVISRGGDGARGADGASGRDGMSGTPGRVGWPARERRASTRPALCRCCRAGPRVSAASMVRADFSEGPVPRVRPAG